MNGKPTFAIVAAICWLSLSSATAQEPAAPPVRESKLEWIRVSDDKSHFVGATSGKRFVIWGVNYDHDAPGRLIEDYWTTEWETVVQDFQKIKLLNANVVRIHLQLAKFMDDAKTPNQANLMQLAKLVKLAETTGLYLDVTGLGCYHKQDVPKWYDELEEADRWAVQQRFWKAVAEVCRESPAVFCYDLMNEPVLAGGENDSGWLAAPLGDKYFVQRITRDLAGRTREEVAKHWVKSLTYAIREVDSRHLITVGVIPWAQVFKGAKPLFYAPDVHGPLDFVSVHFYPKKDKLDDDLAALAVYDVGKPIVIEEIFPLGASLEETDAFIESSKKYAEGWVSFYWGATVEENEKKGDLTGALIAAWLKYFQSHAPESPLQPAGP